MTTIGVLGKHDPADRPGQQHEQKMENDRSPADRMDNAGSNRPPTKGSVARWAIRTSIGLGLMVTATFASAGTLAWAGGWRFATIVACIVLVSTAWLLPKPTAVLVDRSHTHHETKSWDTVLAPLVALSPLAIAVVAGLQQRLDGSGDLDPGLSLAALGIAIAASATVVWAMAANTLFAGTVRIQHERQHHVIEHGPYTWVRHPGYLGAGITSITVPIVLGSTWATIPTAIALVALVTRTRLEDQALIQELAGYNEYARRVRARLVPGIW